MRSDVIEKDHSRRGETAHTMHPFPASPPHAGHSPATSTIRRPTRTLTLVPEEGWLALVLLAVAVYCVVVSIIAAGWVNHSISLLWSPLPGLLAGVLIAKIPRFPQAVLHLAAVLVGHWFSIFLTSTIAFHIPWLQLLGNIRAIITGGMTLSPISIADSEIVFFFYLSFLCFFLGYFGSWLIYRAHLPWLVALVYVSILLVNLNYVHYEMLYLIIIMMGALGLLIARSQLAGQIALWKKEGLHTDRAWMHGITWRCMQVACVLTVIGLLVSYLLPIGHPTDSGRLFWNRATNAWVNVINGHVSLQNLGALTEPYQTPTNVFGNQMTISGSVTLPVGEVINYTSTGGPRYLEGFTYDRFDGHTWYTSLSDGDGSPYNANASLPLDNTPDHTTQISTSVTIVQPPQSDRNYLFAPAQPARFDVNTLIFNDGTATAWTQQSPLVRGERYIVTSVAPPIDANTLVQTPLPSGDAQYWQGEGVSMNFVQRYLQVPPDLAYDKDVQLVTQWIGQTDSAYTALKLIEQHLSDTTQFTYSTTNSPIPNTVDVADWLLKTRQGYCTYYASTMAMMGRLLHIPMRVVNGFSQGHYDTQRKLWIVSGEDAHSWVQAYFPNIGWISFDPTPGFSGNTQAGPPTKPSPVATQPPVAGQTPTAPARRPTPVPTKQQVPTITPSGVAGHANLDQNMLLSLSMGILLFSLLIFLFALGTYWWRNLYADTSTVTNIYWRLCRIAGWAGLAPRRWQTPFEYARVLSKRFPQKAPTFWRLTELFVHDRYGPAQSPSPATEKDAQLLWTNLRGLLPHLLLRKKSPR